MQPKPKSRIVTYIQRLALVCVAGFICYVGYSFYVFRIGVRHTQAGLDIRLANLCLDQYLQDNGGIIPIGVKIKLFFPIL
jgi:hypothetical protein